MKPTRAPRRIRKQRGMTLVELMIVVAMIAVMATLAVVGYAKYVDWARISTTKDVVNSLSSGQEAYYADTMGYLECSRNDWTVADMYPKIPNSHKHHFHDPAHVDYACWRMLQATSPEPTYASFMIKAGAQNTPFASLPTGMARAPLDDNLQKRNKPWYIIIAVGDQDEDLTYSYFMTHSGAPSEVHIEGEDE